MLVSSCILASELLDRRKKVLWMKERLVSKRYSKMQIMGRRKRRRKENYLPAVTNAVEPAICTLEGGNRKLAYHSVVGIDYGDDGRK